MKAFTSLLFLLTFFFKYGNIILWLGKEYQPTHPKTFLKKFNKTVDNFKKIW